MLQNFRNAFFLAMLLCAGAAAQETQKSSPHPGLTPLEVELQRPIDIAGSHVPLSQLFDTLAKADPRGINIVVNWPALAAANVTRDTPISLRLHDICLEDAIRAILTAASPERNVLNYIVALGVVEVTTNAEIAKDSTTRIVDLNPALNAPPPAGLRSKQANPQGDDKFLQAYLRAELLRIGEPIQDYGKALATENGVLAVTASPRGFADVRHALDILSRPTRPGQFPPGAALSVAARKATDALNAFIKQQTTADPLVQLVQSLSSKSSPDADLNLLLLAGTAEELQKPRPSLGSYINNAGILLIGPAATTHPPAILAIYDLREILTRRSASKKGRPRDTLSQELLATVMAHVQSVQWGDLGTEASLTTWHEMLIVFAPAATQREVSMALQEQNK